MQVDSLLELLDCVRPRRAGRWSARCPAHDDEAPSLSVSKGDRGLLIKCHAGCSLDEICRALRIRPADLFHDSTNGQHPRPRGAGVTRYEICDSGGALRAIHERIEDAQGGKRFTWRQPDGRAGLAGVAAAELPLYGTDTLLADPKPVFVVEGEKAAEALWWAGQSALGTVTGAGSCPAPASLEPLKNRDVYLWADNDEPGQRHMLKIADRLRSAAKSVRLIAWPEAPPKGDAADWVEERRGLNQAALDRELAALMDAARPIEMETEDHVNGRLIASPWALAKSAKDFLAEQAEEPTFLEPRLLVRGAVTELFSPRGLGKTNVALEVAVRLARAGHPVLYLDRDNPRKEIRRRLEAWGASDLAELHIMSREQVPPLTDAKGWASFPIGRYELVVVDSFDATAEGVGEQDSGKPSRAIAALLDVARSQDGPAILLLGNTVKSAVHSRGSGVVEDRSDIVYEVRDATDLQPSGKKHWLEELPEAGVDAWAKRSVRRQRRDRYRLAFVASKFRLGDEPPPFILEVQHDTDPWSIVDVTDAVDREGAASRAAADRASREARDKAALALASEVRRRFSEGAPMHAGRGAPTFLMQQCGLTRQIARDLIREREGTLWRKLSTQEHGRPVVLVPPGGKLELAAQRRDPASPQLARGCEEHLCADRAGGPRHKETDPAPASIAEIQVGLFVPPTSVFPPSDGQPGEVLDL